MSGFLTDAVNVRVLNFLFHGIPFEPPRACYAGLSMVRASKAGWVVEPSADSGYARVLVPWSMFSDPAGSGGIVRSLDEIEFARPHGDWDVASVFLADSPSGGTVLAMADLPSPRTFVAGGHAPSIAAGALVVRHN